jgi:predicted transcriptional regulator
VVLTDVSEERIASIFRVEGNIRKSASEETVRTGASFVHVCFSFHVFNITIIKSKRKFTIIFSVSAV